eukprot:scaffold21783_cov51-Phaeocystis_antarctica.AAC.1
MRAARLRVCLRSQDGRGETGGEIDGGPSRRSPCPPAWSRGAVSLELFTLNCFVVYFHQNAWPVACGSPYGEQGDAGGGREQGGLLRRVPQQSRPAQALPGGGDARWQEGEPGQLRHRRASGAVRRAVAGGTGGGGKGGGGAVDVERGGVAAGAGGEADAARGRQQHGLLRRVPQQARPAQALPDAGETRWQEREPGPLRHRRGGGAGRGGFAGGAGGSGGAGCNGGAADERGGAAAGTGGGADAARVR